MAGRPSLWEVRPGGYAGIQAILHFRGDRGLWRNDPFRAILLDPIDLLPIFFCATFWKRDRRNEHAYSRNRGTIDGADIDPHVRRWCMRPPRGLFLLPEPPTPNVALNTEDTPGKIPPVERLKGKSIMSEMMTGAENGRPRPAGSGCRAYLRISRRAPYCRSTMRCFHQETIEHVLVRHEQGAVHAAEGYARSTGKVGCVLVTSGPGATKRW